MYKRQVASCDVIFAALPHGLSQPLAKTCADHGRVFIDLGADFRLEDEAVYEKWYGGGFEDAALQDSAVYGLCELNREKLQGAKLVANPGCYPTSVALGLYPDVYKRQQKDSAGFINLFGLPIKVRAMLDQKRNGK